MFVEEVCIRIMAVATGVQTGVDTAERELARLDKYQDGISPVIGVELDGLDETILGLEGLSNQAGAAAEAFSDGIADSIRETGSVVDAVAESLKYGAEAFDTFMAAASDSGEAMAGETISAEELTERVANLNQRLGMLTAAYETLSSGKELAASQIAEMIVLYPELAKYIDETSDATFKEGEVVKAVWEAEQQICADKIAAQRAVTDAMIAESSVRINQYTAELAAMNAFFGAVSSLSPFMSDKIGSKEKDLADAQAELADYKAVQAQISASIASINSMGSGGAGRRAASGGGSRSAGKVESPEEQAAKAAKDAMAAYKTEMRLDNFKSVQEQQSYLDELYVMHKAAFERDAALFADYYDLTKGISKKSLETLKEMRSQSMDESDFKAVMDAGEALLETVKASAQEYTKISEVIAGAKMDLANFNTASQKETLDELITAEEERIKLLKSYEGLAFGEGEVYTFDSADEIESYSRRLDACRNFKEGIAALGEEMTAYQRDLLDKAESQETQYLQKIHALYVASLKSRQQELAQLIAEEQKLLQQNIAAVHSETKAQEQAIKEKYAVQIQYAKDAADAEIRIIKEKIAAIDRLLKQRDMEDMDAVYERKRLQLEQMILYERDDANKYELNKELTNLTDAYHKRKEREALEAERAALQAELSELSNNRGSGLEMTNTAMAQELASLSQSREVKIKLLEQESAAKMDALQKQMQALQECIAKELELAGVHVEDKAALYAKDGENAKNTMLEETKSRAKENSTQLKGITQFYQDKYKKASANAKEERSLFASTTAGILNDLFNSVHQFAQAGRSAGEAYADGFASAIEGIAGFGVGTGAAALRSAGASSIAFNQTITAPVASPATVARETREALTEMVRYVW